MKRKLFLIVSFICIFIISGCSQSKTLQGYYVSGDGPGTDILALSVSSDNKTFAQYIDQREVNKGTYEKLENGNYALNGNNKILEISLSKDNTIKITLAKLNNGKPITMKNVDNIPVYFSTKFDDVENYKEMLGE